jgi:hypothetical protein
MSSHTPRQLFELKPYNPSPPKPAGLSRGMKAVIGGLLLLALVLIGHTNGGDNAADTPRTDHTPTQQARP